MCLHSTFGPVKWKVTPTEPKPMDRSHLCGNEPIHTVIWPWTGTPTTGEGKHCRLNSQYWELCEVHMPQNIACLIDYTKSAQKWIKSLDQIYNSYIVWTRSWSNGSTGQSTRCSCTGSRFGSQHPRGAHNHLQLQFRGAPTSSSGLHGHLPCM